MPERAIAYINGTAHCPDLRGKSVFTAVEGGTVVDIDIRGLPAALRPDGVAVGTHGLCFHEAPAVNPDGDPPLPIGEPCRAGQLPALFSREGTVAMYYYTDKFTVDDLIGLGIAVHCDPCAVCTSDILGGGIVRAYVG